MIITKIIEEKVTSTGKPQQIVLVDNNPQQLTYWGDDLKEGQEFDGQIIPPSDPKYKPSLKPIAKSGKTASFASKTASVEKAMDRKENSIKASQDAKYEGITRAGAIRCATDLLVAMLNNSKLELAQPLLTSADVHKMLEAEIKYYESLYTSPFL